MFLAVYFLTTKRDVTGHLIQFVLWKKRGYVSGNKRKKKTYPWLDHSRKIGTTPITGNPGAPNEVQPGLRQGLTWSRARVDWLLGEEQEDKREAERRDRLSLRQGPTGESGAVVGSEPGSVSRATVEMQVLTGGQGEETMSGNNE